MNNEVDNSRGRREKSDRHSQRRRAHAQGRSTSAAQVHGSTRQVQQDLARRANPRLPVTAPSTRWHAGAYRICQEAPAGGTEQDDDARRPHEPAAAGVTEAIVRSACQKRMSGGQALGRRRERDAGRCAPVQQRRRRWCRRFRERRRRLPRANGRHLEYIVSVLRKGKPTAVDVRTD